MDAARDGRGATQTFVVQGKTVSLPVVVRDATSMSAMFMASTAALRRLIPDARLYVPELFPGRTLCIIAGIEYRDNDLGRYNEASVAFFVKFGGSRPLPLLGLLAGFRRGEIGAYIHRLPVTTSFSRDAGRDIWGFPKTVDQIDFHDDDTQRSCTWTADGARVFTLSMRRGGHRRMPDMPQDAYAWRDGVLWKTPSVMGGDGVGMRFGGAHFTLGDHPLADELRGLGLSRRALMSTWVSSMHARFEAPIRL
jgi:acetoacetate decarboxylase